MLKAKKICRGGYQETEKEKGRNQDKCKRKEERKKDRQGIKAKKRRWLASGRH